MVIKLRIHGKVDIDVPEWRDLAAQQDDDEIQPESFRPTILVHCSSARQPRSSGNRGPEMVS